VHAARRRWGRNPPAASPAARAVFLAAGFYNLGWGLYAAVDPQWLFRFAQLPLQVDQQRTPP
jgi:hypothetical protein